MLLGEAGAFVGGFFYGLVTETEVLFFAFDFYGFQDDRPHQLLILRH
jgi:hypothetical protein